MATILNNALIVTGGASFRGAVGVSGERIARIWMEESWPGDREACREISTPWDSEVNIENLGGLTLMAGAIDAHVHFRDPGMTEKADMETESKAALLGGVTSFIDMPNTKPATTSGEALEAKLGHAKGRCWANYGFHLGATNVNRGSFEGVDPHSYAGIKVFMGSSTGNLLVDDKGALDEIFQIKGKEILIHSEDNAEISKNLAYFKAEYGDDIPFSAHSLIRSQDACAKTTAYAISLAEKYCTRLHILHLSTGIEAQMVRESRKRGNPGLTCECTPNYLWFSETDYDSMGGFIKCNPSIKKPLDRKALRAALADGTIDTIGSDHAPHLQEEKLRPYLSCPSGVPSIEQSLAVMLTVAYKEGIPMERVASLMSENTASLFGIRDRGRIAEGAFADLVAIDPEMEFSVREKDAATSSARIDYKCGWSPYGPLKLADGRFKGGEILKGGVKKVWLNGVKSVEDGKLLATAPAGQALVFDR